MTQDPHSLTGAYALDALDDEERRQFEEHLAGCETCAAEVTGLTATAARLGAAAAVRPPESFHRAVTARVRSTRQLPPLPSVGDGGLSPRLRRARARSRVLMAVAAALLVAAGGLGSVAVSEHRRAARAEQAAQQLSEVLAAPDARTLTAAGSSGGARVVFSAQRRSAVFVPRSMAASSGRALQLWVIRGGKARSAGLLRGDRPLQPAGVEPGAVLGVTVEPPGGSRQPTSAPVLTVPLT